MKSLDIVFHAGVHKTATTHLQSFFTDHTKAIRSLGVRYLETAKLRAEEMSVPDALGCGFPEERKNKRLLRMARGASRLLVSEENMLGRFFWSKGRMRGDHFYPYSAEKLSEMANALTDHRSHLAMSVREPCSFLTSMYSQVLYSGNYLPWDHFAGHTDPLKKRWSDTVIPIVEASEWESVTIWKYEDYHSIFPEILNTLLGADLPKYTVDLKERRHAGLSAAAVEACDTWHAQGYKGLLGHIAREDFPLSNECPPFQPWDAETVAESTRLYDEDMNRLSQHPKITVLQVPKPKG